MFIGLFVMAQIFAFPLITGKDNKVYASSHNLEKTITGIINWKKSEVGSETGGYLINDTLLELAGSTPGDWFPFALGRYDYKDNNDGYLAVIEDVVSKKYKTQEKLDAAKATEWHRISLAVSAMGGAPDAIGQYNGAAIDLIADGTYNRGLTRSPGAQGINGWIWGLIALDSKRYEVPKNAYNTRTDFIIEILRQQLERGGFALDPFGGVFDPDITSMAVQALSPYYNSEIEYQYTYENIKDEDGKAVTVKRKVRDVVDECIALLSHSQQNDGDYVLYGASNVESTVWVMTALLSLGIDIDTDTRFIKNGNTLLDGIMKYKTSSGGFAHSFVPDSANPTAVAGEANTMASEQTLYGLVALHRYRAGMRGLFDIREEFSLQDKQTINSVSAAIQGFSLHSTSSDVQEAISAYKAIPTFDRQYVSSYKKLVQYANMFELELPNEGELITGGKDEESGLILYFSPQDKLDADRILSEPVTTKVYGSVVRLLRILRSSEDFDGRQTYIINLEKTYNEVNLIQNEIDSLISDIKEKLYPFDKLGLKDKKNIETILNRYDNLSDYDKSKIDVTSIEALRKSKTQLDNIITALVITGVCITLTAGLTVFIIINIKKRKKRKLANSMPESEE